MADDDKPRLSLVVSDREKIDPARLGNMHAVAEHRSGRDDTSFGRLVVETYDEALFLWQHRLDEPYRLEACVGLAEPQVRRVWAHLSDWLRRKGLLPSSSDAEYLRDLSGRAPEADVEPLLTIAAEVEHVQERHREAKALLRECLSDYGHPNFTDRGGMADRLRRFLR